MRKLMILAALCLVAMPAFSADMVRFSKLINFPEDFVGSDIGTRAMIKNDFTRIETGEFSIRLYDSQDSSIYSWMERSTTRLYVVLRRDMASKFMDEFAAFGGGS